MDQNLKIDDLLSIEAAGTRLLAGRGGIERRVLWAHSCELPGPYQWLGPNELLMTVGLCIPRESDGQVELVRRLDQTGIAGMMIGDNQLCPELHQAMLDEADVLGFPVMLTAGAVPFASVGRIVAAANANNQTQQVMTLTRLYQAVLDSHGERDGFMRKLGSVFQVPMSAVDVATGVAVLPGALDIDPGDVRKAGLETPRRGSGRITRIGSLRQGDISAWQISAHRHTLLLVDEGYGSMLDSFTLAHLSQVIAGETNRRATVLLAEAQRRSLILTDALDGESNFSRLKLDAEERGLGAVELIVAVALPADEDLLFDALSLADIPHASAMRKGYFVSLLPANRLPELRGIYSFHGVRAGISPRLSNLGEVREAVLQAQWAHESIGGEAEGLVHYEDAPFSISPRSESEANEVVERVLGPLHGSGSAGDILVETLCTYLDSDRSWAATSEQLGIHRQTLAYRLGKIEQLTGRSLKSSRDIAELWVARISLKHR